MSDPRKVSARRRRYQYSSEQLRVLEQFFSKNCNGYVDSDQCRHLADTLGISYQRIKIWFQNRRAKAARSSRSGLVHGSLLLGYISSSFSGNNTLYESLIQSLPVDDQNIDTKDSYKADAGTTESRSDQNNSSTYESDIFGHNQANAHCNNEKRQGHASNKDGILKSQCPNESNEHGLVNGNYWATQYQGSADGKGIAPKGQSPAEDKNKISKGHNSVNDLDTTSTRQCSAVEKDYTSEQNGKIRMHILTEHNAHPDKQNEKTIKVKLNDGDVFKTGKRHSAGSGENISQRLQNMERPRKKRRTSDPLSKIRHKKELDRNSKSFEDKTSAKQMPKTLKRHPIVTGDKLPGVPVLGRDLSDKRPKNEKRSGMLTDIKNNIPNVGKKENQTIHPDNDVENERSQVCNSLQPLLYPGNPKYRHILPMPAITPHLVNLERRLGYRTLLPKSKLYSSQGSGMNNIIPDPFPLTSQITSEETSLSTNNSNEVPNIEQQSSKLDQVHDYDLLAKSPDQEPESNMPPVSSSHEHQPEMPTLSADPDTSSTSPGEGAEPEESMTLGLSVTSPRTVDESEYFCSDETECGLVIADVCSLQDYWYDPPVDNTGSFLEEDHKTDTDTGIPEASQTLVTGTDECHMDKCEQPTDTHPEVCNASGKLEFDNTTNDNNYSYCSNVNLPDDVIIMFNSYRGHPGSETCTHGANDHPGFVKSADDTCDFEMDVDYAASCVQGTGSCVDNIADNDNDHRRSNEITDSGADCEIIDEKCVYFPASIGTLII